VISSRDAGDAMQRRSCYLSCEEISGLESWGISAALELNFCVVFAFYTTPPRFLFFVDILRGFIKNSVYYFT
jgi:hypothetical protein